MKLKWTISQKDIRAVRELLKASEGNAMMKDRLARNLATEKPRITKHKFWKHLVICLLTTQQKSGPGSAVSRFAKAQSFPLTYPVSMRAEKPQIFFRKVLSEFGGLRRHNRIADELATNLERIQGGLWPEIRSHLDRLRKPADRETEVLAADFIDKELKGFGPKQARNLLQALGLTRYEIPIDSRITKWLNRNGFPIQISTVALSDRAYYGVIMDGICQLAEASDVWPCLLDAAIFVSFDQGGWTDTNVGW